MAISGYWTASKFTKTVILLGLAGYELIITNSACLVGYVYISSYPPRPRRITVNYNKTTNKTNGITNGDLQQLR